MDNKVPDSELKESTLNNQSPQEQSPLEFEKKTDSWKTAFLTLLFIFTATTGILSLQLYKESFKKCGNECELSRCDCKCYLKGQTPEVLENKICEINCLDLHNISGCECRDNKCVEVVIPPDSDESGIRIAAFNIQIFGKTKREKEEVMNVLKDIAQEFDIMLVQEIRDVKEETASYYRQKINEAVGYEKYAFKRSERLGRSTAKEAYAYFYNTDKVEFIENSDHVYNDVNDVFEREPYIASFRSGNFDFTLVGIHTKPDDADSEIGHLANVVDSILAENPNEKDIIVMGDFNADGSYFDENDDTNPFKASKYYWVITNDMDTMTKTDWTYDRMVMMESTLNYEHIDNSTEVFYFDKKYGIDDETFVWAVSDHYPIYADFETDLSDDD